MSSPLEPIRIPRIEPPPPPRRLERRPGDKDGSSGRGHSDEQRDEDEQPEDDGLHIDVLA
jgi:hypothetical protein